MKAGQWVKGPSGQSLQVIHVDSKGGIITQQGDQRRSFTAGQVKRWITAK